MMCRQLIFSLGEWPQIIHAAKSFLPVLSAPYMSRGCQSLVSSVLLGVCSSEQSWVPLPAAGRQERGPGSLTALVSLHWECPVKVNEQSVLSAWLVERSRQEKMGFF